MKTLTLVLAGMVAVLAAGAPSRAAVTVVDDSGAAVTFATPPQRIISLTPATTEMLFAIGDGPRVVGGTTSDDYPPAARKIARVGDWAPNYERVLALRPDLIVVDDIAEHDAVARLRSLHQTVLAVRPATFPAVEADIRLIGRATGVERGANAVVASMEAKVKEAEAIASGDSKRPAVLPVIAHDPLWVAGSGTFIDDAIRRAGGINTAASVHGYVQYSIEAVLAHPPDVILADQDDARALAHAPAFRSLAAIRAHRIVSIDPDVLQRPGPRLADGILLLAKALHPAR